VKLARAWVRFATVYEREEEPFMRSAKKSVGAVLTVTLIMSLWLAGCGPTNGLPPVAGEFLYISNNSDGSISEFSINTTTGALTRVGSFSSNPASGMVGLAVHPSNEFIYGSGNFSLDVFGFNIGDQSVDGVNYDGLIFLQSTDIVSLSLPNVEAITPNGAFLYVTDTGSSSVSEYSINQHTGVLTSNATMLTGLRPVGVMVEAGGNYAYVVNSQGTTTSVSEYLVEANGTLAANGTLPLSSEAASVPLLIAEARPAQATACAYVTDNGLNVLHEMAVDTSTGALTYLGNVPVVTPSGTPEPQAIAVHPSGKFIYTGDFDHTIAVFTQVPPSDVGLAPIPPCTVTMTSLLSVSASPFSIVIEPTGQFAYTANNNNGTVGEFSINQSTGALTAIGEIDSESPPNPKCDPASAVTTH
jgi:6-phosphogluconolactonase (cycloisomerase 2 family)